MVEELARSGVQNPGQRRNRLAKPPAQLCEARVNVIERNGYNFRSSQVCPGLLKVCSRNLLVFGCRSANLTNLAVGKLNRSRRRILHQFFQRDAAKPFSVSVGSLRIANKIIERRHPLGRLPQDNETERPAGHRRFPPRMTGDITVHMLFEMSFKPRSCSAGNMEVNNLGELIPFGSLGV